MRPVRSSFPRGPEGRRPARSRRGTRAASVLVAGAGLLAAAWIAAGPAGAASRKDRPLFPGEWPAVSPDGRSVAFHRWVSGNCDIYVAPIDGSSAPRRLTTDPALDRSPAWSPDGKRICFVSGRSGNKDLWVMDVAEPDSLRQLTLNTGPDEDPAWSPDGTLIAYTAYAGQMSDLYLVPAEGGEPVRLTRDRHDDLHPTWSPDGKRIAFVSDRREGRLIWMLDVGVLSETATTPADTTASGAPHHFYQLTRAIGEEIPDDTDPAWSPVSDVILFSSMRRTDAPGSRDDPGTRDLAAAPRGLYTVTTGMRPILSAVSTRLGVFEQPAWAPNGRDLLYVRAPWTARREEGEPVIWIMENARGGK